MNNFWQSLIISKKKRIQIHILHEIEKYYNHTIQEATFNIVNVNNYAKLVCCAWGNSDSIKEYLNEYHKEIKKCYPNFPQTNSTMNASFNQYIFVTQKEFFEKRNEFYIKHDIKRDNLDSGGAYFSEKEISTFILNRLKEFEIKTDFNEINKYIKELHDFNYIKQISCPDKFEDKNERGYYYDLTDKGRNVINTIDNSYILNVWQKIIIFMGLIYTIIQIIITVLNFISKSL